MRKITNALGVLGVAVIVCALTTGARKGKPLSGYIKDGLFSDTTNGFSVRVNEDWKAKLQPAEGELRLELIHENPQVETRKFYKNAGPGKNATSYSRVRFLIVPLRSSKDVLDSMTSENSSWKIRKDLWADMRPSILGFSGDWFPNRVASSSRGPVTLASGKGSQWRGKIAYKSGGTDSEVVMGLFMTAIEDDRGVLLVTASCNESIMDWLAVETVKVLDSVKFLP